MSNASDFIIENGVLTKYVGPGGDVVIPDSVQVIGSRVFTSKHKIVKLLIPSSVSEIRDSAFTKCDSIKQFDIQNENVAISHLAFGYGKTETRNTIYLPEHIYVPNILLDKCSTAMQKLFFTACYYTCVERHPAEAKVQYEKYAKTNKKKLLSAIIQNGNVNAMKNFAAVAINKANAGELIDEARQSKQETLVLFLQDYVTNNFPNVKIEDGNLLTYTDNEFEVKNGELIKYTGRGGNIVIPDGVTRICRLFLSHNVWQKTVSITIPSSVKKIDKTAFKSIEGYNAYFTWYYNPSLKLCSVKIADDLATQLTIPQIQSIFEMNDLITAILNNPDGFEGVFKKKLVGYINSHKKYIAERIIADDRTVVLEHFLQLIAPKANDIDMFIKMAEEANGLSMARVFLLNYKNEHFGYEGTEKCETEKMEEGLNSEVRTLAQWRKIFKIRMIDGGVEIAGYKSDDENVIIPSKIESYDVKNIAEGAFKNCRHIRSVFVSASLLCINRDSFSGCSSLREVVLPEGLRKIDLYAFSQCNSLESVSIPDTVKYICDTAFWRGRELQFEKHAEIKIHAPAGSYAETYAKENNIPFVAE